MERHVSSYRIHLNVYFPKPSPIENSDIFSFRFHRKLRKIFRTSSHRIGDYRSKPRINVLSWLRLQICWYARPVAVP